jgi:uncharacterized membrane protein YcaP (DUF421 family)
MFFAQDIALDTITKALILGPVGLLWVIVVAQIIGLRTFSKMTAFDFVATVATGSLLAGAASADQWPVFFQNLLAILTILLAQAILAKLRKKSDKLQDLISNDPVLVMKDGKFYYDVMAERRVSEADIWSKLREANALKLSEVRAVVLETTGDISVLHGPELDDELLTGVNCNYDSTP